MAKVIELKPQNRTTWNSKIIPANVENLLARIAKKNSESSEAGDDAVESGDDTATLNVTGLKEITAIISFNGIVVDTYVVTPSGVFYQFSVDITNPDFDFDWWTFAFKNYKTIFVNNQVKKTLADFVGLDVKEVKGSVLFKSKNDDNSDMGLTALFDNIYPPI